MVAGEGGTGERDRMTHYGVDVDVSLQPGKQSLRDPHEEVRSETGGRPSTAGVVVLRRTFVHVLSGVV